MSLLLIQVEIRILYGVFFLEVIYPPVFDWNGRGIIISSQNRDTSCHSFYFSAQVLARIQGKGQADLPERDY